MDIGKSIRKNREFHGLSRQELADILNINVSTLGRYETGKRTPSLTTLKDISYILSIDFDILISWTDLLNTNPDVFDFLESLLDGFEFPQNLAHLLGTNKYDKHFKDFFNCKFLDKSLYIKTADILELTDTQLYNWILVNHIKNDFYFNKESYIRKYNTNNNSDQLDYDRVNYMITSNGANLENQSFDELFYKGINSSNKSKIQSYFKKIYNKSINKDSSIIELSKENTEDYEEYPIDIKYSPTLILKSILNYSENEQQNNKLKYLTDEQMTSLLNKVVDLVEYELYKIEKITLK